LLEYEAVVLSLGLLLSACASLRQLVGLVAEKPELKLVQVEVQAFSVQRIDLVFVIDAYNPNSFALDIESFQYKVSGLGLDLGQGALEKPFVLAGKERSQLRLPFAVVPEVALKIMKKYLSNPKELKLLIQGHLHLDTAFGKMDHRFEEEKALVKGLPGF
jgi:LEA14-like dessication related protein